jgi:hypothetical protein
MKPCGLFFCVGVHRLGLTHLCTGCRDLLSRLLRVRTKERISMPELLRHPWLSEGLPPLAPEHPPSPLQAAELVCGA